MSVFDYNEQFIDTYLIRANTFYVKIRVRRLSITGYLIARPLMLTTWAPLLEHVGIVLGEFESCLDSRVRTATTFDREAAHMQDMLEQLKSTKRAVDRLIICDFTPHGLNIYPLFMFSPQPTLMRATRIGDTLPHTSLNNMLERLKKQLNEPGFFIEHQYHLITNNCQHFIKSVYAYDEYTKDAPYLLGIYMIVLCFLTLIFILSR